jgi:hypothetical protein
LYWSLEETVAKYEQLYAVGREKSFWNPFGEGEVPLTFTLTEPIRFANSRQVPGLQLADIFVTSTFWALKHLEDELVTQILRYVETIISQTGNSCILPQPDVYLQPGLVEFVSGLTSLQKLTRCSVQNKNQVLVLFMTDLRRKVSAYNRLLAARKK